MGELSERPNIGPEVERQLNAVGIMTFNDLKNLGTKAAWLKIKEIDYSACIHRLYALEGAIQGIKTSELDSNKKMELKEFFNSIK